ncbi:RING-HC finger protein, partial [Salmonella sp. s51228]|uniref:RING-HC finger protein n=1 Tax=Salmonella sp. s51228 TaxID=3159652 RepID=UPI00397F5B26
MSEHKPGEEHCVICMDTMNKSKGFLNCGHSFCRDCISEWSSSSRKCPICKQSFTGISKLKINFPPTSRPFPSMYSSVPRSPSPTLLTEIPLEIGMVPSKRMFGHYKCICGKWWKSGYA